MDALIFSCGTGGGHNSAANALKQELLRRGHRVTMLDPYSLSNTRVGSLINQSYINLVKKTPRLFGLVYQLGNLYRRLPVHSPVYHINHRMALPVQRFLEEGNFDLIIMPHIFPGEILTNMRDHGICLPPTLLIATDYTCIPFTEEVQCDRYVIPSDDLCPAFTRWGIPKERLYPLGIPVDQSFENPPDKQESLRRLGLDPSLRYLLVVGGSMGAGGLMRVISILQKQYESSPDIRLIVICGSNQPLYRRLKERYGERLLLVQHTSQMADYMKACELLISKPGGLSSTEAAVSCTPLIHINPIPGCESKNMEYFSSRGMSLAVHSLQKELLPAVEQLLQPSSARQMLACQQQNISHHAAERICDLAQQLVDSSISAVSK